MRRALDALIALDVAINVATGGRPGDTLCARAHQARHTRRGRAACALLDALGLLVLEREHCRLSFEACQRRAALKGPA